MTEMTVKKLAEQFKNKKRKRKDPDAAIKKMVANAQRHAARSNCAIVPENTIEYIYMIYVKNMEDNPLYVGRSKNIKKRLQQHISESKKGKSQKCITFRTLIEEGYELCIKVLETVDLSTPNSAEDLWITNFIGRGITLLNSRGGDQDRYVPIIDPNKKEFVWSVEQFENAVWDRDDGQCKSKEWHTVINGVDFYRMGWSKLRMNHPIYGPRSMGGYLWPAKLEWAVKYLTRGTPEHKLFLENIKWWRDRNKKCYKKFL